MDKQPSILANLGPHHPSAISTHTVISIVKCLLCKKYFEHSGLETSITLEIHLRCIVASLRLLFVREIKGKGALEANTWNDLNSATSIWFRYHRGLKNELENYNNEFLIALIQNLVSTVPSNELLSEMLTKRTIAVAKFVGHVVCLNFILC